jgi:2-polyprenyl-3-methyl-5-hydroxy-6-metoxy-1,4-benzoquinol methylase
MNWRYWRGVPWIDTRARFVAALAEGASLLDLGSSDGNTLRHFAQLRPDLKLSSSDIAGSPADYPAGTDFRRADFDADPLPWADASFDGITCMHVVEHLRDPSHLLSECARLLRTGGRLYLETPHPKSLGVKSVTGRAAGTVTMNFFDDPTHVAPVTVASMSLAVERSGLEPVRSGRSRNIVLAAAFPLLWLLRNDSRMRYVAQLHATGWSAYVEARKA